MNIRMEVDEMFIGRTNELTYLNEKYSSSQSEFIVLYGKRRIGKTELLKEFVHDKKHIFYAGNQITDFMQLKRITPLITKHFNQKIYSDSFDGWENLFIYISEQLSPHEKTVLVFDEFPYMVEANTSIPSILQSSWDHMLKDKNIMLVICGSSMSFMEKDILSEKNPLYGRTTGVLKLNEMDFLSARGFMPGLTINEQIAYYSIFSGVPYYLSLINSHLTLQENVVANIMGNGSVLFNEPEFLLKQELREVNVYNAIISTIALGKTKSNEISQLTGVDKNKLPYYLNSLINLGIIKKEFPSTIKTKELTKSRAGIYILNSSFFKFYYRFIYSYISELMDRNIDILYEDLIEPQLSEFIGHTFEDIAISYLRSINGSNTLPLRFVKIGRWWNRGTEIDIVGYDLKNNYVFGECKWRNEKMGMNVLKQLQEKSLSVTRHTSQKYYALFSKSGFTKELEDLAKLDSNLLLFDFSTLFK